MCGIFALVQPPEHPVDVTQIRRACSLMEHRGPDQSGFALLNNRTVGFGHNRLSIQDPAAPPQPLVDASTGTTIIFNGEVYDHIEIGRDLREKYGRKLTDSTDTAVILALYLLYGPTPEFFSRLNGEFAFVIWDAQRRQLVAVRDRFGIKPLFWYYDTARLVFSSEVKAILSVDGVERRFSNEWLDSLSIMMPFVSHAFAEGVYEVKPGTYLTTYISNNRWGPPKCNTYWSALSLLRTPNTSITYEEAKAEVRRLLTASVKRRLVADREICVYLSGGVDSTVVCGLVASLGHPLTAITLCFGDHPLSEEDVAVKTAQQYGIKHETVTFTSDCAARRVEKTLYHTEAPFFNAHSIAKLYLSEFARDKGFVVALTGEGSDELFLGYSPFRLDILLEMRHRGGAYAAKVQQLTEQFRRKETNGAAIMLGTLPEDTPTIRGTPSWNAWNALCLQRTMDEMRAPYKDGHSLPVRSTDNYAPFEADGLPGVRLGQLFWIEQLPKYIFPCLGDGVEMASSMEGRTPLLDPKFGEFVLRLPTDYLVHPDTLREKRILYEAFEDMLPPHVFARTKQPFVAPPWHDTLFGTDRGKELVGKYLSREAIEHVGLWLPDRVENMMAELQKGSTELDSSVGLILSTQIMHDLFFENPRVGDPQFYMVDNTPEISQ